MARRDHVFRVAGDDLVVHTKSKWWSRPGGSKQHLGGLRAQLPHPRPPPASQVTWPPNVHLHWVTHWVTGSLPFCPYLQGLTQGRNLRDIYRVVDEVQDPRTTCMSFLPFPLIVPSESPCWMGSRMMGAPATGPSVIF